MKKSKKLYRLTLLEDETHKSIVSFRFSKLSASLVLAAAAVVICIIGYCLTAFTPLRSTIPGYPDAYSRNIAVNNAIKIDSLESIITRWEFYAGNLSRILEGEEAITLDSIVRTNPTKYLTDVSEERMREADSLVRAQAAKSAEEEKQ